MADSMRRLKLFLLFLSLALASGSASAAVTCVMPSGKTITLQTADQCPPDAAQVDAQGAIIRQPIAVPPAAPRSKAETPPLAWPAPTRQPAVARPAPEPRSETDWGVFWQIFLPLAFVAWIAHKLFGKKKRRSKSKRWKLPSSIKTTGEPLTLAQAAELYREALLDRNPNEESGTVSFLVENFAQECKMRLDELQEAAEQADMSPEGFTCAEIESSIAQMRRDLAEESDPQEKASLADEIEDESKTLAAQRKRVKAARAELAAFRNDKRAFLVKQFTSRK